MSTPIVENQVLVFGRKRIYRLIDESESDRRLIVKHIDIYVSSQTSRYKKHLTTIS